MKIKEKQEIFICVFPVVAVFFGLAGAFAVNRVYGFIFAGIFAAFFVGIRPLDVANFHKTMTPTVEIVLAFILGLIILGVFFASEEFGKLWKAKKSFNITLKKNAQLNFLLYFYGLFALLPVIIFQFFPEFFDSEVKKLISLIPQTIENLLGHFSIPQRQFVWVGLIVLAPLVWTGLLFYPLVALIALRQYRNNQGKTFNIEQFKLTAPFRWQTFAYPLPGLRHFLIKLAQPHDAGDAFDAIHLPFGQ